MNTSHRIEPLRWLILSFAGLVASSLFVQQAKRRSAHSELPIQKRTASITAATPAPASDEDRSSTDDECLSAITKTDGPRQWKFLIGRSQNKKSFENDFTVTLNGKRVYYATAGQLQGMGLAVKLMAFPNHSYILAALSYPGAGHPIATHFFRFDHGQFKPMGYVGAENGGPVFQDYDHDGKPEWVFDDYNWYKYYSEGPKHLLVYKENAQGQLTLWKRLSNPQRKHLPRNIGFNCY